MNVQIGLTQETALDQRRKKALENILVVTVLFKALFAFLFALS
jgi:hypothetical protein